MGGGVGCLDGFHGAWQGLTGGGDGCWMGFVVRDRAWRCGGSWWSGLVVGGEGAPTERNRMVIVVGLALGHCHTVTYNNIARRNDKAQEKNINILQVNVGKKPNQTKLKRGVCSRVSAYSTTYCLLTQPRAAC